MIYNFDHLVPQDTTATTKERTPMVVRPGVIHLVEVQFPIGCAELVHVQIFHALTQLYPSNERASFAADGFVISIRDSYSVESPPYELTLYTWNTSEDYDHRITVRLGMLPKSAMLEYVLPVTTYFMFKTGIT